VLTRLLFAFAFLLAAQAAEFTPPHQGDYTARLELRFTAPGAAFRLEAGGVLEAVASADGGSIGLRLLEGGREVAAETEHLKPVPHKGWGAGAEEEMAREAAALPGWHGRWFTAAVEVHGRRAWFWFDGRAIGELALAAAPGVLRIQAPAGVETRPLGFGPAATEAGGFRLVELAGYTDGAAPGAPRGRLRVGGIPFAADGNAIDVSRAGLRIRKKPRGPGSLYGNPFNSISAMDGDPLTILLRVPKRMYRRAWLLCRARPELSPKLTVRVARYRGEGGSFFADTEVRVPQTGKAYELVEVALDSGAMQEFLAAGRMVERGNPASTLKLDAGVGWMELEFTRELRADLNAMLPLGERSGVEIYAVTLEESPVTMLASTTAAGHLFDLGVTPAFSVELENTTGQARRVRLEATVTNRAGGRWQESAEVALGPGERREQPVRLAVSEPGKYDVAFTLGEGRERLLQHRTSFAIVPPDTRRAERDSPFGLWSWGGGHLTAPNQLEARLMRKAGARFTLGVNYPSKREWGIGTGTDSVIGVFYTKSEIPGDAEAAAREMVETMRKRGSNPLYWQIYWEDAISDRHHNRYPPSMAGRPPMELNEAERARLNSYWTRAEAYARQVREQLPGERLALGAFANFTEEFLRRGFPRRYLDAISLEATAFRTQPERQPHVDTIHGLYFVEQWKKMYGYQGLDTILVESLFRGTAPGYLSERQQADYYSRDFLLGLAYGVKLFAMSAMTTDVSNDYYRSAWGNVGLFGRAPEPAPKESFMAYETLTSVLDRARYQGSVETGTPSVYALGFASPEGENLYALWTTRGRRPVQLDFEGAAAATVTDAQHRQRALAGGALQLSESVQYVRTRGRLARVRPGAARYAERPGEGTRLLERLGGIEDWKARTERDAQLEDGNARYPRRPGTFHFRTAADGERGPALEVAAEKAPGSPLIPTYGVLERAQPLAIPGAPRRLGLWVNGNSGWGRVSFELVDAKGERWTGVGGSEDAYGHSFVNFDGWRWMEVELPGQFRPDYPWPYNGNWTATGGDGVVDYPLQLTRILVEARHQVVYVNSLVPVARPWIRLRDLSAVY
jgi:hypothetical protein